MASNLGTLADILKRTTLVAYLGLAFWGVSVLRFIFFQMFCKERVGMRVCGGFMMNIVELPDFDQHLQVVAAIVIAVHLRPVTDKLQPARLKNLKSSLHA